MVRLTGNRGRPSRFDRISSDQEKAFRGETAKVLLSGKFQSFTGREALRPHFEAALAGFRADVKGFRDAAVLTDGFVLMCNARRRVRSKLAYSNFRTFLKVGLLTYAKAEGLDRKPLRDWPTDLGRRFVNWLKVDARNASGEPLNPNTSRKLWGEFCSLLAQIAEEPRLTKKLPELAAFPNNPFSGARGRTKKTKSLGLSNLIAILRAARADFKQSVDKFRHAQALFKGDEVLPHPKLRSKVRFRELDALLWYLESNYPGTFPPYTSWRETDLPLFEAINKLHGGWGNVGEYFFPFPEGCVAPILLMSIYGHFNVEPLRVLRLKQVRQISVMRAQHVEVRTAIQPGKNRGSAYRRSFPVDDNDFASPNSILNFMKEWTARIRRDAGPYSDCVFIFKTREGEVKTFATATLNARSGDSKWIHHLSEFCKRHKLPDFNLRELRQTALDYGRMISDDDIRELAALKGGSSQSVLDFHYRSDAAEVRFNENIAELQASNERFARTAGKSQHRGAKGKDISAATPGCKCLDAYDSPIPGEVEGELCKAFGCCPGCPHGSPELGSPRALGRLLQLRQALEDGKTEMPMKRWVTRYKPSLDTLNDSWIPMFQDPAIWKKVKSLALAPIGVIE